MNDPLLEEIASLAGFAVWLNARGFLGFTHEDVDEQ
jgi:hypothetical protein